MSSIHSPPDTEPVKRRRGRPPKPVKIMLAPIRRPTPDAMKLARALLNLHIFRTTDEGNAPPDERRDSP